MHPNMLLLWTVFTVLFVSIFSIDMFVTDHRKGDIKVKNALMWTSMWVLSAFAFAAAIYFFMPAQPADAKGRIPNNALEFIAGYLTEYSLSVDNLFVFIVVFAKMGIPHINQPRILKWGIIGAIVLRGVFIIAGVGLIHLFWFMPYIFGAILVYTALKMFKAGDDDEFDPENSKSLNILKKIFKVKGGHETHYFFVKENGKWYVTIAFITLCLLDILDLIFAVDSIPAVLGITTNSFIAITSNLFAILGLRSLFFALSGLLGLFRYLKYGITFILFFIGVKMLIAHWVEITSIESLIVIVATLALSILLSVMIKEAVDEVVEEIETDLVEDKVKEQISKQ